MRFARLLLLPLLLAAPAALAGAPVRFPAFDADHAGRDPASLDLAAALSPQLGFVVHDGLCAYSAEKRLGCFDPASTGDDLACAQPVVLPGGVVWLFLHHALYVPYDGSGAVEQPFPLWAYDHVATAEGDGIYVWGMGDAGTQELWRWNVTAGAATKALDGPAEMSGGVARWPSAPQCLALTTYAAGEGVCDGTSTVWQWCPDRAELAPQVRFPGCSGRILVARDAVWVPRATSVDVHPLTGGAARQVALDAATVALATDAQGAVWAFRVRDGALTAAPRADR